MKRLPRNDMDFRNVVSFLRLYVCVKPIQDSNMKLVRKFEIDIEYYKPDNFLHAYKIRSGHSIDYFHLGPFIATSRSLYVVSLSTKSSRSAL